MTGLVTVIDSQFENWIINQTLAFFNFQIVESLMIIGTAVLQVYFVMKLFKRNDVV
jgi:hypothetical protein